MQKEPSYRIRTVTGWRERQRQADAERHSRQFALARMPGKDAAKLKKGKP